MENVIPLERFIVFVMVFNAMPYARISSWNEVFLNKHLAPNNMQIFLTHGNTNMQ